MKVIIQYEEGDFDSLHDTVYDMNGKELSHEELKSIWVQLPEKIHALAIMWGMSDTQVRDEASEYLHNNPELCNI